MSLLVGYHIKEVLTHDTSLTEDVDNRIYPLVIPQGAPAYPFIVFRSDGISTDGTKDGNAEDSVNASVVVIAKEYMKAIQLANKVRYDLEGVTSVYDDFQVNDCVVTGSYEEFLLDIDAVAVTINFNLRTLDY